MRKTVYATGRDGIKREMITYGGLARTGGENCPKECNPEYKCRDCKNILC